MSKTLAGALAVFLLAVGLAACGGGSDDGSSSTEATAPSQAEGSGGSTKQAEVGGGGKGKPAKQAKGEPAARKKEAGEFTPKRHNDSGGGSAQFEAKGGDNSVQEFGEEGGSGEFEAAATTLHNFLDARADGNWAAACEYLSKSVVESFESLSGRAKQIEAKSCAGVLENLINPAAKSTLKREAEKANVGSLRVEGERAFLIYTGAAGTVLAMPMIQEGGDWKVASLAGTPIQ